MTMSRIPLSDGWQLTHARGSAVPPTVRDALPVPATVPGTVHTDLLAAELIADPYLDDNERTQAWIGRSDWTYRRTIAWTPDSSDQQALVFEGLDTIAEVQLNGRTIAATQNMHRTYRIPVTGLLLPGDNELEVRFSSPVQEADRRSLQLGARPHVNEHPYNAIRKMACSFGWDWGIDTATSGIWKPVTLERWSTARLTSTRTTATIRDGIPTVRVRTDVERTADIAALHLDVRVGDVSTTTTIGPDAVSSATVDLDVPGAALWWPTGHGGQPLHTLTVTLRHGDVVLDRHERQIGFRHVEVRTEPDSDGIGFELLVNGERILIRGANWIPDDAFPHRVDRERYAARLDQAEFARINLLRVWGGGIYETDDFYDECDRRGILTWQDFLFACAAYSEAQPLRSEIEAEAREAVERLGTHPSLVIFNGNNENLWARQDWGWERRLDGKTWGAAYYLDILPAIVHELAPHVAYTPGSPFTPDPAAPQNDPRTGTTHIWDLWNSKDWPRYRDYDPRFVAEFGWQGPPTWSTLVAAISDDPLTPESPGMLVHQKANEGNRKLEDGLVAHFPVPTPIEDWHWAMTLNQAAAMKTAIEWFRSRTPKCTGTIMWQLNDCWPVTSWSAVDGNGRGKPLLHALRQAHDEQLITVQPVAGRLRVTLVNDTADPWDDALKVKRVAFDGTLLAAMDKAFHVGPRQAIELALPTDVAVADNPAQELLVAAAGRRRSHWFFTEPRDSDLAPAQLRVNAERIANGWALDVHADNLVRDLTLLVDRLDPAAHVDQALITLLPQETIRMNVTGALTAEVADFASAPVLRTANDLLPRDVPDGTG